MKRMLLAGAFVVAGSIFAGCGPGYGSAYVRYGPPAPRYGAMGYAPGPGYVWTEGYWDWRGNNWYWVNGRWMRPPHAHATWVAPQWRQHGHAWRFHSGYWR